MKEIKYACSVCGAVYRIDAELNVMKLKGLQYYNTSLVAGQMVGKSKPCPNCHTGKLKEIK